MQEEGSGPARAKLSAFVIAYDREPIIGTCLRALAFADEIIVVDKGSTDGTLAIAAALADRVIGVPWSPTVEETRAFAAAQCTHDWILFLDDDECLSPQAVRFIDAELAAPRADIYTLPQRHYIMGLHDERAYYWPEQQMRLFHRGSVAFTDTVHGGSRFLSDSILAIPPDDGACIHHLSHRDVAQFIEKANRYTSQPDRRRSPQPGSGIARFAHERIDHWLAATDPCEPDAYPVAVAVLRAVYDQIDRLKSWEEEAGQDGAALFRAECARLDAAYAAELPGLARPHTGAGETEAVVPTPRPPAPEAEAEAEAEASILGRAVLALRDSVQAQRAAIKAVCADIEATRQRETAQRDRADEMQRWAESEARRATELETRLGDFFRHHETVLAGHDAATAARLAAWESAREEYANQHAALTDAVTQATARAQAAEDHNRLYEASTSWRLTAPMRAVLRRLGRR